MNTRWSSATERQEQLRELERIRDRLDRLIARMNRDEAARRRQAQEMPQWKGAGR